MGNNYYSHFGGEISIRLEFSFAIYDTRVWNYDASRVCGATKSWLRDNEINYGRNFQVIAPASNDNR